MDLEEFRLYDTILCVDLKSFFASVECVERGKNPLTYALLVADKSRGDATIVLAVSPYLKEFGVPSRCRLFEVRPKGRVSYEIAQPRMSLYLAYSYKVMNIYLRYVSADDLYVYSVDESFMDLTSYMLLYNMSAREVAQLILDDIHSELGLYATAGIGSNMVMAKYALDIDAKHMPDNIAEWTYKSFQNRLWPIRNLTKVWGIGVRTEKRLQALGIRSMYQLALCHPDILYEQFGVKGHDLFLHAHCIDVSKIQDKYKLQGRQGYGIGQTLFRKYYNDEVLLIFYEQCQELAKRLRNDKKAAQSIAIGIQYSGETGLQGVHKQIKMDVASCHARTLYMTVEQLFRLHYTEDMAVKKVSLSVTKLITFRAEQPTLFEENRDNYSLDIVVDRLNHKYGLNTLLYGSSYLEGANQKERNTLIGGHKA